MELDALIFAPTMVTPPEWIELAVAATTCPIVIWSATQTDALPENLDHLGATVHTSLVGTTMFANCLVRSGRRFVTVDAVPNDPADMKHLARVVSAAVAAGRLRTATALRIGTPIPGYRDVETTERQLSEIGVREITVSQSELERAFAGVAANDVELESAGLRARNDWSVAPSLATDRSVRLALALRQLACAHRATVGTVNCHSNWFRQSAQIGIVACLGVSLLHEQGIPFSCTGDLPAAMAALVAKSLSGSSLYCELYVREPSTDEFLVAAGGEGDPTWAAGGVVDVIANEYYPGRCGAGLGLRFALPRGPATLIGMTPTLEGWRLIWALGFISGRSFKKLDGPNGTFKFAASPGRRAAEEWITAGPTHHLALARGHLDLELPIVAQLARLENVRI